MDPLLASSLFGNPLAQALRTVSPVYFGRDVSLCQGVTGSSSSSHLLSCFSPAVTLASSHVAPTAQNALPCFPLYEILQASQTSSTVTSSLLLSCSYSNSRRG